MRSMKMKTLAMEHNLKEKESVLVRSRMCRLDHSRRNGNPKKEVVTWLQRCRRCFLRVAHRATHQTGCSGIEADSNEDRGAVTGVLSACYRFGIKRFSHGSRLRPRVVLCQQTLHTVAQLKTTLHNCCYRTYFYRYQLTTSSSNDRVTCCFLNYPLPWSRTYVMRRRARRSFTKCAACAK